MSARRPRLSSVADTIVGGSAVASLTFEAHFAAGCNAMGSVIDQGTFDYAGYLQSLEAFRVSFPLPPPSEPMPQWRWPVSRPYNGFTGEQRISIWQVTRWAQNVGLLSWPKVCSVCQSRSQVAFHNENYAHPWTPIPLCHACHMAVHGRFRSAKAWEHLQAQYGPSKRKSWFAFLGVTPVDLASWLRSGDLR